jgi:hypothetical protein
MPILEIVLSSPLATPLTTLQLAVLDVVDAR